jgi:hypothetical protein
VRSQARKRELRLKTGALADAGGQGAVVSAQARELGPEGVALIPFLARGGVPGLWLSGLGLFAGVRAGGAAHPILRGVGAVGGGADGVLGGAGSARLRQALFLAWPLPLAWR